MKMRACLEIQLDHLRYNIQNLKEKFSSSEVIFMVKANAYGHGVLPITNTALEEGVRSFGVATLGEALSLRTYLKNYDFNLQVYSSGDLEKDNIEYFCDHRITPVISNMEDLEFFLKTKEFSHMPFHLKVNTGMNRLGVNRSDLDATIRLIKQSGRKSVTHLLTHYACSFLNIDSKRNQSQRDTFLDFKKEIQGAGISIEESSMANSGALEQLSGDSETHIRPGLMLYGLSSLHPNQKSQISKKLLSSLKLKVIHAHLLDQGAPIGYGATPIFQEGKVLICSGGYGDGLSTRVSGAKIKIGQEDAQFLGRVSMDSLQLFVDKSSKIERGDIVTIWEEGSIENIDQILSKTLENRYELLTHLGERVTRKYL